MLSTICRIKLVQDSRLKVTLGKTTFRDNTKMDMACNNTFSVRFRQMQEPNTRRSVIQCNRLMMSYINSRPLKMKSNVVIIINQVSRRNSLFLTYLGNLEMPPFSSLNADVIPTSSFLESLETYQPKFDPELIKEIWKSIGMQTSDERLFKLGSAMLEIQMLKIIQELRTVAP